MKFMIYFFEIFLFYIGIFLFSLSVSGYGKLINLKIKDNFFLDIFLGFVIISFIVTTIHFFFKINLIISSSIFLLGLILSFIKNNNLTFFFKKKNIIYLIVVSLLIPMFLSQKYHEDFGYYHLPYALGFIEEKIVLGYANIDQTYVYNSIWLNLYSLFFLNDKNFDFLTFPSYLLFLSFILFSLSQIISTKKTSMSDYYLIVVLFYFILKFTRISEFGVDLPSVIFSLLGIYYFIKYFETTIILLKKKYFFLVVIFSIFSILIKLSTLPIIFLSFYIYLTDNKNIKFSIFEFKYIFVFLLITSFFIQQFLYTGCTFFPTDFTCLNVSWFNPEYLNLSKKLELINKSYFHQAKNIYSPEEYLNNLNWFIFWFKRNFVEILEHSLTIFIPSLLFLFCLKKDVKFHHQVKGKKGLYIYTILGLIFWLNFAPVYRFAIHLFLTLIFIILSDFLLSRKFSMRIFFIFISIFILFSFSKNMIRLNKVDDIYLGVQKINNKYLLNETYSNEFAKVFRPDVENNSKNGWQGRLCWNTPFICSYSKLDISKKNGYLIINKIQN